jgi:putative membrane protein
MLRIALAGFHLLALGIGLGAVWVRARSLRVAPTLDNLRRALSADAAWGIAAVLWIGTGLWRVFGSTEKSTTYYMHNHLFFTKMTLLVVVLLLEGWPMVTLNRWRIAIARGEAPPPPSVVQAARRIALISYVEAVLVVLMMFVAVAMARGVGVRG